MSERQPIQGPWRVEADTLPEMAYDHYRHTLIHETSSIKAYLTPKHHERTILVAPKGYGKTLLLIAKKKSFLEARSGQIVMAENRFIERPLGIFPVIKRELLDLLASEICWLMTGTAGSSLTTINILKPAKFSPIF